MHRPKHFNYDISYQMEQGNKPPNNTPNEKKSFDYPITFNPNIRVIWPNDQIYYTRQSLSQLIVKDYSTHPLVQHLHPLSFRRPLKITKCNTEPTHQPIQGFQDFLVFQKKREMLQNQSSWLQEISHEQSQQGEFKKNLKFKLNQLSSTNYTQISEQILKIVQQNQNQFPTIIIQIIEKAATQNKYRAIYSELCEMLCKRFSSFNKELKSEIFEQIRQIQNYEQFQNLLLTMDKDEQIIQLTKRKLNRIGRYKFCAQLYKDNVLSIDFIDETIIVLVNEYIKNTKNTQIQQTFQEEPLEGVLEIISTMKNNLFMKQYKEDVQLEKQYIEFIKQIHLMKIWNKNNFRFSKNGLKSILNQFQQISTLTERMKLLITNLIEKIDGNWQQLKQKPIKIQKNYSYTTESSDSEKEEPIPLQRESSQQKKIQIKLNVNNLDSIHEEEFEYSVNKQPSILQILQCVDKIFSQRLDEFNVEILKFYEQIKLPELILTFWNSYIKNIFRLTKENALKVEITYTLLAKLINDSFYQEQIIQQIIQKVQDLLFDFIDSPFGLLFMKNLMTGLIKVDENLLAKLQLEQCDEELQQFFMTLLPQIINYEQAKNAIFAEQLSIFLEQQLKYNLAQQQQVWESIK